MPSSLINSIHKKTGVSKYKLETKWDKAKKIAAKEYGLSDKDKRFWPIAVGIFKKSLGKDVESKIAAHVEVFVYIKSGMDIEDTPSLPKIDIDKVKNSIIKKANAVSGIPLKILSQKWDNVKAAVISTYCIQETDIQFIPKLLSSFRSSLTSMNPEYGVALASAFNFAVAGTSKVKAPTMSSLPVDINPEAVYIWKAVIKKEKKTINKFKDNLEKWAAAVVFFKRACAEKGISPWVQNNKVKKASKEPSSTFLAGFADPCLVLVGKMEKYLTSKKLATKKLGKFKLSKIAKSGKDKILIAEKTWKLLKTEAAASVAVLLISQFGLRKYKARGTFRKSCSSNSAILIKYSSKADTAITVSLEIKINSRMWKSMDADKKDVKKYLNTWVNKGFKASASTDEGSSEDLNYLLKTNYSANSREEAIDLLNRLTIPTIVNLGDTPFQVELAKYVKDIADKYEIDVPESLINFITSEKYRNSMIKEFGNVLPDDSEDEGTIQGPRLFKE